MIISLFLCLCTPAFAGKKWCWLQLNVISRVFPVAAPVQGAARRLIDGLREDALAVKKAMENNEPLILDPERKDIEQLKTARDDEEVPEHLNKALGAQEMSNIGLRQALEARFFRRLEAELEKLSPRHQHKLLLWLSMVYDFQRLSSVYTGLYTDGSNDVVYQLLGKSNESRRFVFSVIQLALNRLWESETVEGYEVIIRDALDSGYSQLKSARRVKSRIGDPKVQQAFLNVMADLMKQAEAGKLSKGVLRQLSYKLNTFSKEWNVKEAATEPLLLIESKINED